MIIGIGVDVCDIKRFEKALERTPRLKEKLFTPDERDLPIASLAARFAAKEAIAKSLGSPGKMLWQDVTIRREVGKRPEVEHHGTVSKMATEMGVRFFHLSLSHDGGVATAMVVAEG